MIVADISAKLEKITAAAGPREGMTRIKENCEKP
jgi:hypothetical protein